jgi:hypothetical protein
MLPLPFSDAAVQGYADARPATQTIIIACFTDLSGKIRGPPHFPLPTSKERHRCETFVSSPHLS